MFLRQYYGVDNSEAKITINKIFYGGGRPSGDVPFLHALRCEVSEAAEFLTKHVFYAHLAAYYDKRRRPLYGQLSSILRFRENSSLEYIIDAVEAEPLCLMYDGAIFQCSSLESIFRTRQECVAVSQEIGVGVAVKQWIVLGGVCDDGLLRKWKNMISSGAATRIGPLSKAPGR